MKHLIFLTLSLIFVSTLGYSQAKNFIDLPYIETSAKVDTLVIPDRIYLTIILTEKDTKGKISLESLEQKMADKLTEIGVDLSKQLTIFDLSSNFKKYFLKQPDVLKAKSYSLLVYDAKTAMKVIVDLESENISNVLLEKTEYSQIEQLRLELKTKAILKAKENALSMANPLNQKVGNAIFISDFNDLFNNVLQGRVAGVQIRGISNLNKSSAYEPIDIEFQKIKVEAEINVRFRLE
ncbi:SIMPL domain-containing protein [Odoribacter sp. OttesenSCG-928-J03]|nr:SIMPL domain-containing protein [Odoribacter sp. OttesenSCG-928-J03]MDL2330465.1 SIMPL domain-containing protein [Odoribacter sp. OttesenSCG-928-A06]